MEQTREKHASARRMTSIARRLHWSWIGRKIGVYAGCDFLLFLLSLIGWIVQSEMAKLGKLDVSYHRYLSHVLHLSDLAYCVADEKRTVLLELSLFPALQAIGWVLLVLAAVQLFSICASYVGEERKIRQILAPIDEIALRAEELSRMTFTEDKYQQIEDAISQLSPDKADLLSFGDADLQGIEAAMNNLLLRMRESYRQQARFVNDASHELRTPIAVIEGYANMLARWGKEDEKVLDESIAAIRQESEHMKYLVEQLLFLARGDSGKTRLAPEPVSLNQLMREVYEEYDMIDQKHPYRFEPADEEPETRADAALLKQAVRILVDNAEKFTKEGGAIALCVGQTADGRPYLQIQDEGIGMAQADVEHMFERFYRADDARNYQGTGLGLSIAKWIVDKHKGHFEILSRAELGTRIRILL